MNPRVVAAKYAVRGAIPTRAAQHAKALQSGNSNLPFGGLLWCNIGNPQAVGMEPISYYRQALGAIVSGNSSGLPSDLRKRMDDFSTGINIGAYTDSTGSEYIRKQVANFLTERDSAETDPDSIMMCNGASEGVSILCQTLIEGADDEILIPIPQYPLYSATITLVGGTQKEYYLDESSGWSVDASALKLSPKTKMFVVINPGNPTGACLDEDTILSILRKVEAEAPNALVVADEVYQDNIWGDQPFVSFRQVAKKHNIKVPLATFHSTSKGLIGECGARGGFCQFENVDPDLQRETFKLRSISLCPGTYGQTMMALLVTPPKEGDESYDAFADERGRLYASLTRKAQKMRGFLNDMEGVSCQEIQGAMYAFPSITLPEAFQAKARDAGMVPDEYYCQELLDNTGIVTVPGSGFGQKEGTFHVRTTILPKESDLESFLPAWGDFHQKMMSS